MNIYNHKVTECVKKMWKNCSIYIYVADKAQHPSFYWHILNIEGRNFEARERLAWLTRMYLATPTISVPCELLFSDAGNTLMSKRASMKPDIAEMIIFLHYNRKNVLSVE